MQALIEAISRPGNSPSDATRFCRELNILNRQIGRLDELGRRRRDEIHRIEIAKAALIAQRGQLVAEMPAVSPLTDPLAAEPPATKHREVELHRLDDDCDLAAARAKRPADPVDRTPEIEADTVHHCGQLANFMPAVPVRVTNRGVRFDGREWGSTSKMLREFVGSQVYVKMADGQPEMVTIWALDWRYLCRAMPNVAVVGPAVNHPLPWSGGTLQTERRWEPAPPSGATIDLIGLAMVPPTLDTSTSQIVPEARAGSDDGDPEDFSGSSINAAIFALCLWFFC